MCVCDCVCVLYSQHCFYLNPTVSGANTPNTLCDSIFVFDFMKKKIHTACFSFLSLRTDSVFLLVVWAPVVYSHLVFSFFFRALHLALLSDFLPLAYGGLLLLLLLLLLRQPLWPFDCMETRFCTSVTDAANVWRETMEKGNRGGGEQSRAE